MLPALPIALFLASAAPATDPPNVVLIVSDDQAWTDFGFLGHEAIRTPRLDRLAAESAVFPRGYVPTSLCRPSLATIVTGLHPHEHGITGNDPPAGVDRERMLDLIDAAVTVPELLSELGYRSLQTGKWWEGNCACGGFDEGMTHGDPARGGRHGDEGLRIGRETMQPIVDFVDACTESDTPFLLWYAPFLPHRPHDPPERLLAEYRAPGRSLHVARYMAMCERFDETCGELLDLLDARGIADDTLVLFVVDNGWIQREDGPGYAPRSKRSPYEGGVRTPILVRWPGRVEPGVREEVVSSIDLAPTILAAAGHPDPPDLPGVDLAAVARGEPLEREGVFGAIFHHDVVAVGEPARGLRSRYTVQDRWKLIRPVEGAPELYDLVADPHETRDLASDEPQTVERLDASLDAWWPARVRERPNLLLIVTDDQRDDLLGCAGHPVLETPVVDRLAAEGARFTNAFVTTPICAASRASLLTSRHESSHGYTFGRPPVARERCVDAYPAVLRAAGYRTGFLGKWGVRIDPAVRAESFDTFRPLAPHPYVKELEGGVTRHLTDLTADAALEFLAADDGRPFCLTLSFNAPHAEDGDPRQYVWPEDLDDLYADAEIPPPPLSDPEVFEALPEFLRTSLNRVRWGWRFDTREKQREMTRGYYRMISGVDRAVGRVLAELERRGVDDETVVVFTSDNGYFLGERGFAGKWLIYEESIRVPLIVRDPRADPARRGTTLDAMALNLDVAPTLLDIAGVPVPASYEGRSLVPLLAGRDVDWRTDFYFEHRFDHERIPESEGVRSTRHAYARYVDEEPLYEQLFDLETDPEQLRNLADDPEAAELLARMRARCDELAARWSGR